MSDLARGLKVHLRIIAIHRAVYRVVTLRPQTTARFSTNYFHDTWHILAGPDGVAILGRLLWGLAFQRHRGTLVLIDGSHLVPTPFEADPPAPIMIVPDGLTSIEIDMLRALRRRLRRPTPPPTTIRWHTFGMPAALDAGHDHSLWQFAEHRLAHARERMSLRGGFVCYTAPPAILRAHALAIYGMRTGHGFSSYRALAEHRPRASWHYDGELQLLGAFDDEVSAAMVARREVVGDGARPLVSDEERRAVWHHQAAALARLRAARARRR